MPPTESRSRDEWLAEVRRRGERIRRRRRITAALVGALALVLPVTALTTFLGGAGPGSVELSVAGPAPTAQVSSAPDSPVAEPGMASSTRIAPAPATGGSESPTTTAEVHGRVAVINGSPTPRQTPTSAPPLTPTIAPTTSVPPADDPVVRPPAGTTATTARSGSMATADTTIPPANAPVTACTAADIRVAATTEKTSYAPGETVRGSSTLENRSASTCLVSTWISVEILNPTGQDVFHSSSGNGYASDLRTSDGGLPVKAEPGTVFTGTFHWVAGNCAVPAPTAGSECAGRFPPGTYTAVVRWGNSGGPTGRTTFQLTA